MLVRRPAGYIGRYVRGRSQVLRAADGREELRARPGVGLEAAEERGRHGRRARGLDAAHAHAHVRRLDDDADAAGPAGLGDGLGDLRREPLLHLQALREHVGDARELGQAQDLAVGDVGDVALAEEGHDVVLAERVELDVLDEDHLAVVLGEDRAVEHVLEALRVARRAVHQQLGHAPRRVLEALAARVLAERVEDRRHRAGDLADARLVVAEPPLQSAGALRRLLLLQGKRRRAQRRRAVPRGLGQGQRGRLGVAAVVLADRRLELLRRPRRVRGDARLRLRHRCAMTAEDAAVAFSCRRRHL
mmetsp:Transcript_29315/g.97021  ORF Transcript_29315/g.97021 Transcript_29315/m.97021 type:complete len:304 (-) Transcript_29315:16-927(-)